MKDRIAFHNGRFVFDEEVSIAPDDAGFVYGASVTERLRTFGGRLFRLDTHLERLRESLRMVGGLDWFPLDEVASAAEEVIRRNASSLDPEDDQGLVIVMTPGTPSAGPTLVVQSYPLPFSQWSDLYDTGQPLVVSSHRQVPSNCWPPSLKCRSRMHYYLADAEARRRQPGSRALVLDQRGYVAEATTANILAVTDDGTVYSPRTEFILPGISLLQVRRLCQQADREFAEADLSIDAITDAAEVFLCSTSPCMIPVNLIDGQPIGTACPGPVFQELIELWEREVGIAIRGQAHRFADRRT